MQEKAKKNKKRAVIYSTRLVANPIYAGKIYENKKHFDGKHKAIIDPDLFFAIQNTLPKIVHTKIRSDRVYLLRGLARCGHHNCGMTPYHARGKNKERMIHYYRCVKKQNYEVKCPVAYTNADQLEGFVVDKIKEIAGKKEVFKAIVEQVNLEQETAISPFQDEFDEINARSKEIEKEIENFLDAIGKAGSKVIGLLEKKSRSSNKI